MRSPIDMQESHHPDIPPSVPCSCQPPSLTSFMVPPCYLSRPATPCHALPTCPLYPPVSKKQNPPSPHHTNAPVYSSFTSLSPAARWCIALFHQRAGAQGSNVRASQERYLVPVSTTQVQEGSEGTEGKEKASHSADRCRKYSSVCLAGGSRWIECATWR